MDRNAPGYAGFKDYKPRVLQIYDWWVLGVVAPRVWRIDDGPGVELYKTHMGRRHLDVGPGTGYFISQADPPADTELTLLDANPHVLEHCAQSLANWRPVLVEANVLEPLPVRGPFESAALAHVLHCLPSPMAAKAKAIEHVAATLTHEGVLFGGTVLGLSAEHNRLARAFVRMANVQGGFDNLQDDLAGLRQLLEESFHDVAIEVPSGSIAYFVASRPRKGGEAYTA